MKLYEMRAFVQLAYFSKFSDFAEYFFHSQ